MVYLFGGWGDCLDFLETVPFWGGVGECVGGGVSFVPLANSVLFSAPEPEFSVLFAVWGTPLLQQAPHFARGNDVEHTILGCETHLVAKCRCGK